jgi:hypothetical protein
MRLTTWLVVLVSCGSVFAQDQTRGEPVSELEKAKKEATETRKAAAADPTIKDAKSPPVLAYLAEQKRRRILGITTLRQRIEKLQGDKTKENLIPVLKEQLAELESKPPEEVSYDADYGYQPTTGLVGYSRKIRFLENTKEGKSIIQVADIALVVEGLETSKFSTNKFMTLDKAILIGPLAPDQTVLGMKRTLYLATLLNLEAVLKRPPAKAAR